MISVTIISGECVWLAASLDDFEPRDHMHLNAADEIGSAETLQELRASLAAENLEFPHWKQPGKPGVSPDLSRFGCQISCGQNEVLGCS